MTNRQEQNKYDKISFFRLGGIFSLPMTDFAEKFATAKDGTHIWPVEIRYSRSERILHLAFDDGTRIALPAELLRVESPSAEVRGHSGKKSTVTGKENIGIQDIERVGNYALRLIFDDGHDSGIYSWTYLYELGIKGSKKR